LIASRRDWHQSKGLLKGFKLALRPWESLKNWWRYDQMRFVTDPYYAFNLHNQDTELAVMDLQLDSTPSLS